MRRKPDVLELRKSYTSEELYGWLKKLLPYTKKTIGDLEKMSPEKFYWVSYLYELYLREVRELKDEPQIILRFKKILELFHKIEILDMTEFPNLDQEMHIAEKNMSIMESEIQSIKHGIDFTQDNIVRFNLSSFRKMIEGVLNHQINVIIYILELQMKLNPNLSEIQSRYLSTKYFENRSDKCSIKGNFPALYVNFDNGIRNSEAHFDFDVDHTNKIIRYKSGKRDSLIVSKITFDELEKTMIFLAGISRQISLAYILFLNEKNEQYIKKDYASREYVFEQHISGLALHSPARGYYLENYEILDSELRFFFSSLSRKKPYETILHLLNFWTDYLEIVKKCYNEIENIELILDNVCCITVSVSDLEGLEKNPTKDYFNELVRKSAETARKT